MSTDSEPAKIRMVEKQQQQQQHYLASTCKRACHGLLDAPYTPWHSPAATPAGDQQFIVITAQRSTKTAANQQFLSSDGQQQQISHQQKRVHACPAGRSISSSAPCDSFDSSLKPCCGRPATAEQLRQYHGAAVINRRTLLHAVGSQVLPSRLSVSHVVSGMVDAQRIGGQYNVQPTLASFVMCHHLQLCASVVTEDDNVITNTEPHLTA
jgi:hypothetical protein